MTSSFLRNNDLGNESEAFLVTEINHYKANTGSLISFSKKV